MSALEIVETTGPRRRAQQLHVVREGEVPARIRRRAYAQAVARTQARLATRTYAALGSVAAVFTAAAVTMVWAFLGVPNLP